MALLVESGDMGGLATYAVGVHDRERANNGKGHRPSF